MQLSKRILQRWRKKFTNLLSSQMSLDCLPVATRADSKKKVRKARQNDDNTITSHVRSSLGTNLGSKIRLIRRPACRC